METSERRPKLNAREIPRSSATARVSVNSYVAVGENSLTAVFTENGRAVSRACVAPPVQQVQQSPLGRAEPNSGALARQGPGRWTETEIASLSRLVNQFTAGNRVDWVQLSLEWQSHGLPLRTKNALTSKWRSVLRAAPTTSAEGRTSNISTQGRASTTSASGATPTTSADPPAHALEGNSDLYGGQVEQPITSGCSVNGDAGRSPQDVTKSDMEKSVEAKFARNLANILRSKKHTLATRPRRVNGKRVSGLISMVDKCIGRELDTSVPLSWDRLTALVLAGAVTVSNIDRSRDQARAQQARNWYKNINEKMAELRSTISKASVELARRRDGKKPSPKQTQNLRFLRKEHRAETNDELVTLIKQLGDRLQLLKAKLEVRKEDDSRVKLRSGFSLKQLNRATPNPTSESAGPNLVQVRRFWKKIVGLEKGFNPNDEDLLDWAERCKAHNNLPESLMGLTWEDFERVLAKAKPWKAPGPDGIHSFWWKVFKQAGKALYQLAFSHISEGLELPKWLANGRVVLLHKSGSHDDPANYRPIACLNTSYKVVTALLASHITLVAEKLQVLPEEQVAIRKGTWGCTHAHLLDQAVVADATSQKQKSLHVAWIDYAKAFDSVPHGYLRWTLQCMGLKSEVLQFITRLFGSWTVRYESRAPTGGTSKSAPLAIRSGVLQGDSFSPLLFCIAMAPMSHAINRMKCGYASSAGGRMDESKFHLSHLFYMDDLKIYSSDAEDLKRLLGKVGQISSSIGMLVNAAKCARASHVPKRLEAQGSSEADDSAGDVLDIKCLSVSDTYKYLGIEQQFGIKPSMSWDRAKNKFMGILEGIWSLDLTFRQKVNFTNSILPAVTYVTRNSFRGEGKYSSILKRGDELDKRVRGLLVRLKARYKASSFERMYLPSSLGGYGLQSVRDSLIDATVYAWAYVCTRGELRKQYALFSAMSRRGKRCVLTDAAAALGGEGITAQVDPERSVVMFDGHEYTNARDLARAVTAAMRNCRNTRRQGAWKGLVVAGKVLDSQCDLENSFTWLKSGKLSSEVVRNVIAAQEGCLLTRASPASLPTSSACRMCGASFETPEHVLSACSHWLPTLYTYRHDAVARVIHYRYCIHAGLQPPHHSQHIPSVMSNERFSLYFGFPIQTRGVVRHNKPDIVLHDRQTNNMTIVEVAVSWHTRLEQQKAIKLNRYTVNGNYENDLDTPYPKGESIFRDLESRGHRVTFVPIVVGACGEMSENVILDLTKAGITSVEDVIERMSRASVLGSNRIIKQHLAR